MQLGERWQLWQACEPRCQWRARGELAGPKRRDERLRSGRWRPIMRVQGGGEPCCSQARARQQNSAPTSGPERQQGVGGSEGKKWKNRSRDVGEPCSSVQPLKAHLSSDVGNIQAFARLKFSNSFGCIHSWNLTSMS